MKEYINNEGRDFYVFDYYGKIFNVSFLMARCRTLHRHGDIVVKRVLISHVR